jgi:hypothetical protein
MVTARFPTPTYVLIVDETTAGAVLEGEADLG